MLKEEMLMNKTTPRIYPNQPIRIIRISRNKSCPNGDQNYEVLCRELYYYSLFL